MLSNVPEAFTQLLSELQSVHDIIEGRMAEPTTAPWAERRGWSEFLRALPDEAVDHAEQHGLWACPEIRSQAPSDLRELATTAARWHQTVATDCGASREQPRMRHVRPRKQLQLEALCELWAPAAAHCERVVDVGAGSGHLTRVVAQAWHREALGLDRDERRVQVARLLAQQTGLQFVQCDVLAQAFELRAGDFVVGLHACGELGDELVRRASNAGAAWDWCRVASRRFAVSDGRLYRREGGKRAGAWGGRAWAWPISFRGSKALKRPPRTRCRRGFTGMACVCCCATAGCSFNRAKRCAASTGGKPTGAWQLWRPWPASIVSYRRQPMTNCKRASVRPCATFIRSVALPCREPCWAGCWSLRWCSTAPAF